MNKTNEIKDAWNVIFKLKDVREEIKSRFDKWDERVKNNLQPVPIQDLDYWVVKLDEAIYRLNGGER